MMLDMTTSQPGGIKNGSPMIDYDQGRVPTPGTDTPKGRHEPKCAASRADCREPTKPWVV